MRIGLMIINDFYLFLINKNQNTNKVVNNKVISFIVLFFFAFILISLIRIGIGKFIYLPTKIMQNHLPVYKMVLLVIIIGPLIEESILRLSLLYDKLNISISLGFALHIAITKLLNFKMFTSIEGLVILLLFPTIIYLFLSYKKNINDFFTKVFDENLRLIYFVTSIIFGLIHIFNFEITDFQVLLASVILVLPQLLSGFILGYVRIFFGFAWSVLFHSLHNLLIGFVIYLFINN